MDGGYPSAEKEADLRALLPTQLPKKTVMSALETYENIVHKSQVEE